MKHDFLYNAKELTRVNLYFFDNFNQLINTNDYLNNTLIVI